MREHFGIGAGRNAHAFRYQKSESSTLRLWLAFDLLHF
jgi:hypothetical protein